MEKYKNFAKKLWEKEFDKKMETLKEQINKAYLCAFVIDACCIEPIKQVILCTNNEPDEVYYLCQGLPETTDQAYGREIKSIYLENLNNQTKQSVVLNWLFS